MDSKYVTHDKTHIQKNIKLNKKINNNKTPEEQNNTQLKNRRFITQVLFIWCLLIILDLL